MIVIHAGELQVLVPSEVPDQSKRRGFDRAVKSN